MLKKILFEQIQNKDFWMQAMHEIVCFPTPSREETTVSLVIRTGFLPDSGLCKLEGPSSGGGSERLLLTPEVPRGGEEPGTNTKKEKIQSHHCSLLS